MSAAEAYDAFADLYDAFTWDHDYELWVSSLEPLVMAHGLGGKRVLDVACGTGKSIVPWLDRGYRVVGCDLSPRMLARAALTTGGRCRLLEADMRRLPRIWPVDLVTCLGDSINYLLEPDDLAAAFRSVAAQLPPGGLYVFDVNSLRTYRHDFASPRRFVRAGWKFSWVGEGDRWLEAGGVAGATITACPAVPPGGVAMTSRHLQRHHPISEVRSSLRAAGLDCIAVHGQCRDGSLDRSFAELEHAKGLVLARKPEPQRKERR
jgi:SAM-dependent methyltransferase